MLLKRVLCMAGLGILSSGCAGVYYEASRNLIGTPAHYCYRMYDTIAPCMYRVWANKTWKDVCFQPGVPTSEDFKDGFIDGFVDYLDKGGKGEPPPMPPRKYWRKHYQTPQGHEIIQEWYEGFRLGAAIAKESGYRRYVTIPPAMVGYHSVPGEYETPAEVAENEAVKSPSEKLPMPNPSDGFELQGDRKSPQSRQYPGQTAVQQVVYMQGSAENVNEMPNVVHAVVQEPVAIRMSPVYAADLQLGPKPLPQPPGSYVPASSNVFIAPPNATPAPIQENQHLMVPRNSQPARASSMPEQLSFEPMPIYAPNAALPPSPKGVILQERYPEDLNRNQQRQKSNPYAGRRLLQGNPLTSAPAQ